MNEILKRLKFPAEKNNEAVKCLTFEILIHLARKYSVGSNKINNPLGSKRSAETDEGVVASTGCL